MPCCRLKLSPRICVSISTNRCYSGGTGPTIEPDRSIQHADLVCAGEGEGVMVDIANRLDNRQSPSIDGTWCRLPDGSVQKNPKRPAADLENIAMPCWDPQYFAYINGPRFEREFQPDKHNLDKSYQIMTQRGCPFSLLILRGKFLPE